MLVTKLNCELDRSRSAEKCSTHRVQRALLTFDHTPSLAIAHPDNRRGDRMRCSAVVAAFSNACHSPPLESGGDSSTMTRLFGLISRSRERATAARATFKASLIRDHNARQAACSSSGRGDSATERTADPPRSPKAKTLCLHPALVDSMTASVLHLHQSPALPLLLPLPSTLDS